MSSLRCYFVTVVLVTVIGISYYVLQPCQIIQIEDTSQKFEKEDTQVFNTDDTRIAVPQQWLGCPKPDDGLNSMIITSFFDGRLGNIIWEYLSAWAVAKRYGLFPTIPRQFLDDLNVYFEDFSIPCLEDVAERCGFLDILGDLVNNSNGVNEPAHLLIHIENPIPGRLKYLLLPVYGVLTEELLPRWRELHKEIRFKKELREYAQDVLRLVDKEARNRTRIAEYPEIPFEYVGVHVRRTDYLNHVVNNYPGARAADERFFLHAMQWLRSRLQRPLAFVVVSDDLNWCRKKLGEPDVFIVGNGNETSPGEDLSVLAACNYTIFAYGTFGLSAAMLANGRFTLLYDTQNNTYTKEMEFAPFIPGWHILDDEGKEKYLPAQRNFGFSYYLR